MAKYTVGVIRAFVAQHKLIGGDWGRENQWHSHPYRLEMIFAGDELDRHGYLLDIAVVKAELDLLIAHYEDKTLNELPEFAGLNPGLEPFARILAEGLSRALSPKTLRSLTAKLWENEDAYASFTIEYR